MAWDKVRIVVIAPEGNTHAGAFAELAEVLVEGFQQLGIPATLTLNRFDPEAQNIVLGWHLLADGARLPEHCILYNLEQMGGINAPYLPLLKKLASRCAVWDYSRRNIEYLRDNGFTTPVEWVPIGTSPAMVRIEPARDQDIDVLFYGSTNERRLAVLNQLKEAGAKVHNAFGVYGRERDILIARSRIVLNLHYYEASIFEMVRVSYLLANGKAVVAERNPGTAVDEGLEDAAVLVPYGELAATCMTLLANPRHLRLLETQARDFMASQPESEILRPIVTRGGAAIPSVSVVVITRNRPHFLARALVSLAVQTFKDFEVLVVNDGGEDTAPVLRKASIPVRGFTQPEKRGQSAARNLALRHARGTWVAYLDDDDLYYPDHLETLVETLRTTGAKVAYTDSMRVVEEERQGKWVEVSRELAMSNDFDRQRFLTDNLTPINNVMHERLCWEVADHHDETLPVLEDWEFWIRLSRRWDFVHIPKATAEVRWRANGENITFQGRDLFPGCRLRIAAKVAALLEAEAPLEPALPDGFLFQPDWTRAEWLEILLAYISAFTPGEPVCLLFILDTTQMTLEKAQEMILDMVRRTGHQVFPDVELVDKPGEMFSILQRLRSAQWVPAGRNGMAALEGLNGRRFALARERFRT